MPNVTIDGQQISVPNGTTIIEAAKKLGKFIPHYCYHPGLSISGNCRMCLVEVEKFPKLQISCHTPVNEGMVVSTNSPKVKEAQQSVLEYLLVNHPLDCPVCDQSGECDLQNYYMKYGLYDSRMNENKVKKNKAVPVGPHVMLDAERCVLCTRCVRFCDEVTGTSELGIVNRGNHSEIIAYPETELKNRYSGNVVDICPVGALTDRDFRFKCRVWYLAKTPSVCTGCSRGCNIDIHWNQKRQYQTPDERVMRLKPRFNQHVNQWWICDEGRYGFHFIDQNRIKSFYKMEAGCLTESIAEDVFTDVTRQIKSSKKDQIAVLPSSKMTCEDLYLVKRTFIEQLGVTLITHRVPEKEGSSDHFLMNSDKNPNRRGAEQLGLHRSDFQDIIQKSVNGDVKVLIVFDHDLESLCAKDVLTKLRSKVKTIIFCASNNNTSLQWSDYVIPIATHAEKDGTFINCDGRIQRIFRAFDALGEAVEGSRLVIQIAMLLGLDVVNQTSEEIFNEIAQKFSEFNGVTYQNLGQEGSVLEKASVPA